MSTETILQTNQATIMRQIEEAAEAASRSTEEIKLVAVTKTVSAEIMNKLFELGIRNFGENRSDVLLDKQAALSHLNDQIEWHFIGRLQSRQVKAIIHSVDYLHSLDRLSLAREIQKRAQQTVKCFVQVNVSGEESKAGFEPEQLKETLEALAAYDKIQIVGLMTMAPYDASEEELHRYFSKLKQLQVEMASLALAYAPCTEVSMGMSQDFPIAIAEGARIVRIGSAFFEGL